MNAVQPVRVVSVKREFVGNLLACISETVTPLAHGCEELERDTQFGLIELVEHINDAVVLLERPDIAAAVLDPPTKAKQWARRWERTRNGNKEPGESPSREGSATDCLLAYIAENPGCTTREASDGAEVAYTYTCELLKDARSAGQVRSQGKRPQRWTITGD